MIDKEENKKPYQVGKLLTEASLTHPELRIGQIISIAAQKGGWDHYDPFYCPDDAIINGLENFDIK